jgi:hypothetical protein
METHLRSSGTVVIAMVAGHVVKTSLVVVASWSKTVMAEAVVVRTTTVRTRNMRSAAERIGWVLVWHKTLTVMLSAKLIKLVLMREVRPTPRIAYSLGHV